MKKSSLPSLFLLTVIEAAVIIGALIGYSLMTASANRAASTPGLIAYATPTPIITPTPTPTLTPKPTAKPTNAPAFTVKVSHDDGAAPEGYTVVFIRVSPAGTYRVTYSGRSTTSNGNGEYYIITPKLADGKYASHVSVSK